MRLGRKERGDWGNLNASAKGPAPPVGGRPLESARDQRERLPPATPFLPAPPAGGREGGGFTRNRERSDRRYQSLLPDRPPMVVWGRSEQKQSRRGEAATFRRRMSDWHDQTVGLGVAIARRRPASGIGAVPGGQWPYPATERLASGGKPGPQSGDAIMIGGSSRVFLRWLALIVFVHPNVTATPPRASLPALLPLRGNSPARIFVKGDPAAMILVRCSLGRR